jgi:ribonuclease-3
MDRLGLTFNDPALLEEALTHRSYLNENPEAKTHNERLEFLGDAVLELASTDFLFRKYPQMQEGMLTSYRAALVNTGSLAAAAKTLGLGGIIRLSKGEARDAGRARENILADAFEAIIGALYLDQGYAAAEAFAAEHLFGTLESVIATGGHQDSKSRFQELSQDKRGSTPSYKVLAEEGPDHARTFTVGAYIGQKKIAEGKGKSKQEAEQAAALNALKALGW